MAGVVGVVEGGVFLDGELVEGEVALGVAQCFFQFRLPRGGRVAGQGIDEVEAVAFEMAGGERDGGKGFACAVLAAEEFQRFVLQRLYAEGGAVDAGGGELDEFGGFDRGGVGFEGDFATIVEAVDFIHFFDQRAGGGGLHQARRAAAEKDTGDTLAGSLFFPVAQFGEQRLAPQAVVDLLAHMRVKVAIRALFLAKGPVDVDS